MKKELTAGQISKVAIQLLEARRCRVWRNNNLAVRGRKFIGRKGVSDITGFHRQTGIAVYCEVKTINDRFSEDQIEFLTEAKKAGCITLLATEKNGSVDLSEFNTD